jgi:hypothetical protein
VSPTQSISAKGVALQFSEPPPPDIRQTKWSEIANQLKARPGEWAHLGRIATSQAHHIKSARTAAFLPAGSFEAIVRNRDERMADVWARYVGENGEHA